MRRIFVLSCMAVLGGGCCSTACRIPETEYTRNTPEQTFELFQRAARCDDVDAAYATISSDSHISPSDFTDAWSVAGDRIRALCHTELARLEDEPASRRQPAKKATFRYGEHTVAFLVVQEDGKWLFQYPTRYHTEDELKALMETIGDEAGDCCD